MYNNPYMLNQNYNQQSMNERIDNQIAQLQQMKEQMKHNQQPAINQTIQLSPTSNNTIKYVGDVNEVSKELVFGDTPFFSKDMSIVWVKNSKGDIKTYELNEIIPKDVKDLQIEYLQSQIEELKGMVKDVSNVTNDDAKQNATNSTTNDDTVREEFESKKSNGFSKISRSKKE